MRLFTLSCHPFLSSLCPFSGLRCLSCLLRPQTHSQGCDCSSFQTSPRPLLLLMRYEGWPENGGTLAAATAGERPCATRTKCPSLSAFFVSSTQKTEDAGKQKYRPCCELLSEQANVRFDVTCVPPERLGERVRECVLPSLRLSSVLERRERENEKTAGSCKGP